MIQNKRRVLKEYVSCESLHSQCYKSALGPILLRHQQPPFPQPLQLASSYFRLSEIFYEWTKIFEKLDAECLQTVDQQVGRSILWWRYKKSHLLAHKMLWEGGGGANVCARFLNFSYIVSLIILKLITHNFWTTLVYIYILNSFIFKNHYILRLYLQERTYKKCLIMRWLFSVALLTIRYFNINLEKVCNSNVQKLSHMERR